MTTSSDNVGFIDYSAFGLDTEGLVSLQALADPWARAVAHCAEMLPPGPALAEFAQATAELPRRFNEPAWQRRWLKAWHRLNSQGTALAEIFGLLNRAVGYVEVELFGDRAQIGRLEFRLFGLMRRAAVAAASGALELAEQVVSEGGRFPGEFDAIRDIRGMVREGRCGALLSVSLDNPQHFANLSAGDLHGLPVLLAERLRQALRPQDRLYRGRDGEWLLLLDAVQAMAQPAMAALQIGQSFAEPLQLLSGRRTRVDVRVGIVVFPGQGGSETEPVAAARVARMTLKPGGELFNFFDPKVDQEWQRRCSLADRLQAALHSDELMLYLQPQVEGETNRCVGAELLLRWRTADGEWVPPPLIVDLLEENGWRALFTEWLLRASMRTAADLAAARIDCGLSINLMAGDLTDVDLPELVRQNLAAWRMPAGRFTFELTESAMMADPVRGSAAMRELRQLGCRFALDDFGTGYSSLSYLATLPIDEIKIDRSFIVGMSESAEKLRIVRTIVDLTHDLGMVSLAEGIEQPAQRRQLFELGCRRAQGYLYGRPMPLADFIAWFHARRA